MTTSTTSATPNPGTPLARLHYIATAFDGIPDSMIVGVSLADVRAVVAALTTVAEEYQYERASTELAYPIVNIEDALLSIGAMTRTLEPPAPAAAPAPSLADVGTTGGPDPSGIRALADVGVSWRDMEAVHQARENTRTASQASMERETGLPPEDPFVSQLHRMADWSHLQTAYSQTTTLGNLVEALDDARSALGGQAPVTFAGADLDGWLPGGVDSWRGVYADLALGYDQVPTDGDPVTLDGLLTTLRRADGEEYEGWKGGTYVMGLSTPVWVDNRGEWTSRALTGVSAGDGRVLLHVERVEL